MEQEKQAHPSTPTSWLKWIMDMHSSTGMHLQDSMAKKRSTNYTEENMVGILCLSECTPTPADVG